MERQTITGNLSTNGRLSGALSVGGGTTDYNELENKPTYNGHIIEGELTNESLGIWQPKNYSTEEQNTGIKWIDGKDIYSKTIIIDGTYTGNGTFNLQGVPNNINLIDYNGVISYLENGTYYTLGVGNNYIIYPFIDNSTIRSNLTGGSATFKYLGHINIYYTKN